MKELSVWEGYVLPEKHQEGTVYRLQPDKNAEGWYMERTDRNNGWITESEQRHLRDCVVGIAGCGGMGGLIAATLLRLGVGEIRIADCEDFDVSNINRQFGAKKTTVGKSKAFETARDMREISDDTVIEVYPEGINEQVVDRFLTDCDVVCDMIEFWAIGARILLHKTIRQKNIPLINCDTVGHRTYLFHFTSESTPIEEILDFGYETAVQFQKSIQEGKATPETVNQVMKSVLKVFVPEIPEYFSEPTREMSTAKTLLTRLFNEGKASIIATNPPMASGFTANHLLGILLRKHGLSERTFVEPPQMPGYLMFDAMTMESAIVRKKWW